MSAAGAESDESPQRAMYCAAAQPGRLADACDLCRALPSASAAPPRVDLQQRRRDCHRLQFKAMLSDDPQLRAERDRVCAQALQLARKP